MRHVAVALLAAAVAVGCGEAGRERAARNRRPIIGGSTTTGEPEVFLLVNLGGSRGGFCSGTLVGPVHVLTAGHCVVDENNLPAGSALGVYTCPSAFAFPPDPGCIIPVASGGLHVHPGFDFTSDDLAHDLALLELSSAPNVTPKPLPPGPLPAAAIGTDSRIVGYGITDATVRLGQGIRRVALTKVTHIGPLAADATAPNPFGLIEGAFQLAGMPNTCTGDSGGPVFWPNGGPDEAVYGVTSWGDVGCSDYGVYVDVGAHLCWLASLGVPGARCDTGADAGVPPPGPDAGVDAGADAGLDAGVDAAGPDAGVDAGIDAAGVDAAGPDAGGGAAGVDAAGADAGVDAAVVARSDASGKSESGEAPDSSCGCTSSDGARGAAFSVLFALSAWSYRRRPS